MGVIILDASRSSGFSGSLTIFLLHFILTTFCHAMVQQSSNHFPHLCCCTSVQCKYSFVQLGCFGLLASPLSYCRIRCSCATVDAGMATVCARTNYVQSTINFSILKCLIPCVPRVYTRIMPSIVCVSSTPVLINSPKRTQNHNNLIRFFSLPRLSHAYTHGVFT